MPGTIVIVEDDADIRALLDVELRTAGYERAFARDAVSALAVIRKNEPDLIVLDIGLPGGDGFVVLDRLKEFDALVHIPVVVVSAQAGAADRLRAEQAGVAAFFEKPFDSAELLDAIRSTIGP